MKPRVRDILILVGIFVAGVVTGSINTIGVGQRLAEHRLGVDTLHSSLMDILKSELELTPDQVQRVEPIVVHACKEYQALTLDTVNRVTQMVAATNERLAKELNPQQAQKLRELERQREEMVRRRLEKDYLKKDFLGE